VADRFKIGEGFVSIDTEDDTPKGLARIKAGVDRFTDSVEQKVKSGFASGFDSAADAAERRMAKFTADVTANIDRINAKRAKIDLDILSASANLERLRKEAETATDERRIVINAEIAKASADIKVLTHEAEALDGKKVELEAKLRDGPETLFEIKALDKATGDWLTTSLSFARSFGGMVGLVSSLLSLLGPTTNGIVGVAMATGQWLTAISPLAALIPGFIVSWKFLTTTIGSFGPAFETALKPAVAILKEFSKEAGEVAVKGVDDLAQKVLNVNAPAITKAMDGIGASVNRVVTEIGNWLTTSEGMRVVSTIVGQVDSSFAALAPKISNLVIEIGKFIDRVGEPAFGTFTDLLGKAADKTADWVASLTAADIEGAFDKMAAAGMRFMEILRMIRDSVQWLSDNKDKIKGFSDSFAAAGIAIGIATGNWPAVVAGAVTLIMNHFDDVKTAASGMGTWLNDVFNTIANDPSVQKIVADLKEIGSLIRDDFADAINYLKEKWQELKPALEDAWTVLGPLVDEVLKNPQVQDGLRTMAFGLAAIAVSLAAITAAAGLGAAALTEITAIAATWTLGAVVDTAKGAYDELKTFFTNLGNWAYQTWQTLKESAREAFDTITGWVGELPQKFSDVWTAIQATIVEKWDAIAAYMDTLPDKVAAVFTQMLTDAPAKVGEMAGLVVGAFLLMGAQAVAAIAGLPGQVLVIFASAGQQALAAWNEAANQVLTRAMALPGQISGALASLGANVYQRFNEAKTQAAAAWEALANQVLTLAMGLPGRVGSALTSLGSTVATQFTNAKNQANTIMNSLVTSAIQIVASLPGKAAAALGSLGATLYNAGRQLIQGFIDGIRSMIPSIDSILGSITSKIPTQKGPPEKDRVMLEPAGRLVMSGFGKGIADGSRDVMRQLGDVTAAVASMGASTAARSVPAAAGPSYQFAAGSIVLDASKIKTLQDLIDMLDGLKSTARQYGAVARSA
jgi:hypothetical protein